jgi:choline dehydrogenase-like flavoprotein
VLTGIPGHERVHDSRALGDAVAQARPNRLHVAAFHPVGTAAAGAHPDRSPVDARGALRGVQGVWVADASALPSCPTVNPQVSVMALALAIADRIVRSS